jgi:hypothetical protein
MTPLTPRCKGDSPQSTPGKRIRDGLKASWNTVLRAIWPRAGPPVVPVPVEARETRRRHCDTDPVALPERVGRRPRGPPSACIPDRASAGSGGSPSRGSGPRRIGIGGTAESPPGVTLRRSQAEPSAQPAPDNPVGSADPSRSRLRKEGAPGGRIRRRARKKPSGQRPSRETQAPTFSSTKVIPARRGCPLWGSLRGPLLRPGSRAGPDRLRARRTRYVR